MNAQGFLKHKDDIENLLMGESRPNILGFTETHITQMVEEHELQIQGYVCVRGDSESNKTGGVLLFIDNRIKYEIISINVCERNWWSITVKIIDRYFKSILMLVYHSPSGSDIGFIDFLDETCNNDMLNGNVIIMGDFNIDMKVNNYCQNKLIRVMNSAGLKQLVNEPTRIVSTSQTIIDLIFTNTDVEVKVKHEPKITDHSIVAVYWSINSPENVNRNIVSRNYKHMNVEEFMRLVDISLNAIESSDINEFNYKFDC